MKRPFFHLRESVLCLSYVWFPKRASKTNVTFKPSRSAASTCQWVTWVPLPQQRALLILLQPSPFALAAETPRVISNPNPNPNPHSDLSLLHSKGKTSSRSAYCSIPEKSKFSFRSIHTFLTLSLVEMKWIKQGQLRKGFHICRMSCQ